MGSLREHGKQWRKKESRQAYLEGSWFREAQAGRDGSAFIARDAQGQ
jgi:hypothetical protein